MKLYQNNRIEIDSSVSYYIGNIPIDKKNITSLDINIFDFGSFDYNTRIENFVSLKKFFNLESLVIDFDKFNIKTNKDNGVDLEEVFLNNTIGI